MKNKADYSKYECPYSHLNKEIRHELKGPEGYQDIYSVWCACGFRAPVFYLDPDELGLKLIKNETKMKTMENSKLTWIKGQHASWEGVEMTNENCQKRFGCLELIYSKDDKVIGYVALKDTEDTDTFIIADTHKEAVILTIEQYITNEDTYSYADACDEHHGFSEKHTNKVIRDVDTMITDIEHFTWIIRMPETVKVKDMQEFQDALDYHFEHKLGYTES